VGVVANVREWSLTEKPWPAVYLPISQAPPRSAFLVLHASRPVPASDIGRAVQSVDRDEPVSYIRTGRELLARTTAEPRFRAIVLGIFALLSMLLACIGVYGVVSYLVTQRTHEIGVRVALGATKSDVLRLVVGQGIVSSLIGICVGIGGALALTRLFSTLLYGVKPTDPKTFAFGSLLIACAAFAACLLPAHRATKVDPMVALRHE
jgi:putative ABC transport system permease protein